MSGGIVAERFELVERIGSGGMGTVWKAIDTATGDVVALKLLHDHLAEDAAFVNRLQREVEITRRIDSPHVARTIGFGRREGRPFIVMEYVSGATIKELVAKGPPMAWESAKPILRQVALGLAAAHAAGVVHRDVKPSNIILQADGTPKLIDFGIARADDLTSLTGTSTVMGTPGYMTPDGTSGPAADLYALGCVAFELCTGSKAFAGENTSDVALRQSRAEFDAGRLPPEARAFVRWLVAPSGARRPADANIVAEVLSGTSGVPSIRGPRAGRWVAASAFALVLVAAVVLGAFVAIYRGSNDSEVRMLVADIVTLAHRPADGKTGVMFSVGPFLMYGESVEVHFVATAICAEPSQDLGWTPDVGSGAVVVIFPDGSASVISGGTGLATRSQPMECDQSYRGSWIFDLQGNRSSPQVLQYGSPMFRVEMPLESDYRTVESMLTKEDKVVQVSQCLEIRGHPSLAIPVSSWCPEVATEVPSRVLALEGTIQWTYLDDPVNGWMPMQED